MVAPARFAPALGLTFVAASTLWGSCSKSSGKSSDAAVDSARTSADSGKTDAAAGTSIDSPASASYDSALARYDSVAAVDTLASNDVPVPAADAPWSPDVAAKEIGPDVAIDLASGDLSANDFAQSDSHDSPLAPDLGADVPLDATRDVLTVDATGAAGTCVLTGSMLTARIGALAQLLDNGMVLVAGGLDSSTGHVLASAELYNPATGTFTPAGSMSTPRSDFALVQLGNGEILAAGGVNDHQTPLSSADLYDPVTNTWSPTGAMSVARAGLGAQTLEDGRVLVLGGWSSIVGFNTSTGLLTYNTVPLRTAEIYDPVSGAFASTGSMATARGFLGRSRLSNGSVFVVGGIAAVSPQFTGTAELYNSTTASDGGVDSGTAGTFTPVGTLPNGAAGYPLAATLKSGKVLILILGGVLQTSGFTTGGPSFLFDPSNNTFGSPSTDLIAANNGILLQSGDVFFVGGNHSGSPTAQTEIYQAASGTWQVREDTTIVRHSSSLANLPDGDVLVIGGCSTDSCGSNVLTSAEICTP